MLMVCGCCSLSEARTLSALDPEQDSRLSEMSSSVSRLKQTALAIGEELQQQESLIDGLDRSIDKTHGSLKLVRASSIQVHSELGPPRVLEVCCACNKNSGGLIYFFLAGRGGTLKPIRSGRC